MEEKKDAPKKGAKGINPRQGFQCKDTNNYVIGKIQTEEEVYRQLLLVRWQTIFSVAILSLYLDGDITSNRLNISDLNKISARVNKIISQFNFGKDSTSMFRFAVDACHNIWHPVQKGGKSC